MDDLSQEQAVDHEDRLLGALADIVEMVKESGEWAGGQAPALVQEFIFVERALSLVSVVSVFAIAAGLAFLARWIFTKAAKQARDSVNADLWHIAGGVSILAALVFLVIWAMSVKWAVYAWLAPNVHVVKSLAATF